MIVFCEKRNDNVLSECECFECTLAKPNEKGYCIYCKKERLDMYEIT